MHHRSQELKESLEFIAFCLLLCSMSEDTDIQRGLVFFFILGFYSFKKPLDTLDYLICHSL